MKTLLAVTMLAILLVSCASFTKEDEKYAGLVKLYLAEFGQLQNDLNTYVAKTMGNPGLLKVDEAFRKEFRTCVMSLWSLLGKMTDLKPGKATKDAHRILIAASEQYQAYFTEILYALDDWTPNMTTRLGKLSQDANTTFNTYVARIPN